MAILLSIDGQCEVHYGVGNCRFPIESANAENRGRRCGYDNGTLLITRGRTPHNYCDDIAHAQKVVSLWHANGK